VTELQDLATLVLDLQRERSATAVNTYIALKTGETNEMDDIYSQTDSTLNKIKWKRFGDDRIFESKLRFQIKLDDFR